jgi:hypothetical protein
MFFVERKMEITEYIIKVTQTDGKYNVSTQATQNVDESHLQELADSAVTQAERHGFKEITTTFKGKA